jgi:hypothetical protein
MPQKIQMFLSNGHPSPTQFKIFNNSNVIASAAPSPPSSLNVSMISRIYSVKPGCGSCGK